MQLEKDEANNGEAILIAADRIFLLKYEILQNNSGSSKEILDTRSHTK